MLKILVIEDDGVLRNNVVDILQLEDYRVVAAHDGKAGLLAARDWRPDLILCDVTMPEVDGYTVLRQLRQEEAMITVPFIFMTARAERSDFRLGMELGADDYLTKPFTREELLQAVGTRWAKQEAIEKRRRKEMEDLRASISQSLTQAETLSIYSATIDGWLRALDLRDDKTEGHTQRVAVMAVNLGRAQGLDEDALLHLRWGALLHDIGKIGVRDDILLKTGPLTEEEWAIMRQHPVYAYNMLAPIDFLNQAIDIPYCHHERWDGAGYPRGLSGEDIPLAARIFSVVDVWDALCTDRPYRSAMPIEQVRAYLIAEADKQFDPRIVVAFLRLDEGRLS